MRYIKESHAEVEVFLLTITLPASQRKCAIILYKTYGETSMEAMIDATLLDAKPQAAITEAITSKVP